MSCFKERLNTASSWTHRWAAVGQLREIMYALAKLYKIIGPLNDFEDSATTRKEVPRRRHGPVFTWIILRLMTFPVATFGSGGQRCDLLEANQTGMLPVTVADVGVQDLKRMALRGGLAKLTSMAGNLALRFGFIIVAARLLEPEDFGLVAMVTVVTAMLHQFATAGFRSLAQSDTCEAT